MRRWSPVYQSIGAIWNPCRDESLPTSGYGRACSATSSGDSAATPGQQALARAWAQFWAHSSPSAAVHRWLPGSSSCGSWTVADAGERHATLLESVLGATPQEFESPILRHRWPATTRSDHVRIRRYMHSVCRIFCFSLSPDHMPYSGQIGVVARLRWCTLYLVRDVADVTERNRARRWKRAPPPFRAGPTKTRARAGGGARGVKGGLRRHHLETETGAGGSGKKGCNHRDGGIRFGCRRAWPELVLSVDAGAEVISVNASPGGGSRTRARTKRTSSVLRVGATDIPWGLAFSRGPIVVEERSAHDLPARAREAHGSI